MESLFDATSRNELDARHLAGASPTGRLIYGCRAASMINEALVLTDHSGSRSPNLTKS
jgi:hypothetical protein